MPSSVELMFADSKPAKKCVTCCNEQWSRIVDEWLEARANRTIPEHVSQPVLHAKMASEDGAAELGCDPYPYKRSTLKRHIGECRRNEWERVQRHG